MRFQTKIDTWLGIVLALSAVLTFVAPSILIATAAIRHRPMPWIMFIPIAIWTVTLPLTMPQYYDLRPDGLLIRQGLRSSLVPYGSVRKADTNDSYMSSAAFSSERVLIDTSGSGRFVIAPVDREKFLNELRKRAPQLTPGRAGSLLGL